MKDINTKPTANHLEQMARVAERAVSIADVIAGRAKWATLVGDVRETLRGVPDGCAQTCVTSPPYFGLRDYGAAGQIGQEQSPAEYVAAMVGVMREVRRVLADDGTLWLNVGDSYAGGGGFAPGAPCNVARAEGKSWGALRPAKMSRHEAKAKSAGGKRVPDGLKPKDLLGIPWRLAFALQDDGWYLRSDIVWAKPNPMPESVTDRPTRAHEYVFLLTKRARYFYDGAAIREPGTNRVPGNVAHKQSKAGLLSIADAETRNARDVWTITPEPFAEAHFATMPPELARRCILAGSRKGDVVLDPFGGAATTALVALQHGRRALLCEINPDYVEIQRRRLAAFDADVVSPVRVEAPEWGPMFAVGAR